MNVWKMFVVTTRQHEIFSASLMSKTKVDNTDCFVDNK